MTPIRPAPGAWLCAVLWAVIAAGGCRDRPDSGREARKVTPTSTDDATAPLVDPDYRFRLDWPGRGWKVLRERDARRLNPDAVAALLHDEALLVVIVESLPGLELERYAGMVADNLALTDKQIDRTATTIEGRPEVSLRISGRHNGVAHTIHARIIAHQDHGYQVLAIRPGRVVAERLEQALASFHLVDGTVAGRAQQGNADVTAGLAWRLRDDVLEHAGARLRLRVPSQWRVASDGEVARMNDDASLVLVSRSGSGYFTVIAEPIGGADPAAYLASRRAAAIRDWVVDDRDVAISLGGRQVKVLRAHGEAGFPAEMLYVATVVDGHGVQITIVYPVQEGAAQRPRALAALAGIEFLDRGATATLVAELAQRDSTQNLVGADFALRGGVYHDFTHRLRWRAPPGLWRVHAGDAARADNADARVQAENVITGQYVQIIAEPWTGTADAYRAAVGTVEPNRTVLDRGPAQLGGHDADYVETAFHVDGVDLRSRKIGVAVGGRGVQIVTWSLASIWPGPDAAVAAGAGLEFLDDLRAEDEVDQGRVYRNHRFGFAVTLPSGWSAAEGPAVGLDGGGVGVVKLWRSGRAEAVAVAVFAPDQSDDWMVGVVEQMLRQRIAPAASAEPDSAPVTVSGNAGRRLTWRLDRGHVEAIVVRRHSTLYALLFFDPTDAVAAAVRRDALSFLP